MAQNRFQAAGANDIPTLRRATNNAFSDLARQITDGFNNVDVSTETGLEVTGIADLNLIPKITEFSDVTNFTVTWEIDETTVKTLAATEEQVPSNPSFGDEMYVSVLIDDGEAIPTTLYTVGWYKYVDGTIGWVSIS